MIYNYEKTPGGPGLFENKVNIISAFPGTGKSTATGLLANDMNYVIRDLDSAEFRESLKKKAGPINVDRWYIYYVDYIKAMVEFYKNELDMNPEFAGKTVILMVSSHQEVRSILTARELTYYYAVPTVNMFRKFILPAAAARIDEVKELQALDTEKKCNFDEKLGSVTRAYEFLAQQGEKMINGVTEETAGNVYERVIWLGTDVSNSEDDDDEPEYLYYFIHHNTFVDESLVNITWKSERIYLEFIDNAIRSMINSDSVPCDIFITPRGELAVITPRLALGALAEIFDRAGIDFPTAANFANYKSDHMVISRSDAQDIYEIIEDVITKYGDGKSDYELWGDKSRAFECLYDNLKGFIYKIGLNIRELNDIKLDHGDYDDAYDYDSETEPAFASKGDAKDISTATPKQLADAQCVIDDEEDE